MMAMKCRVDGKAFFQALDKVGGLTRKSAVPIRGGVLVRCEQDYCVLMTTNLERWLSIRLPARGDRFSFLLGRPREAARAFRQFDGELTLEQLGTDKTMGLIELGLTCGPRSAHFFERLLEDYPEPPDVTAKHTFTVNAARLYARVKRVKYSAAPPWPEKYRPNLSNVIKLRISERSGTKCKKGLTNAKKCAAKP